MFDEEPELLLRLAENMQGEDHFGVCLDLAHAYLSGTPLEEWERQLKPYVKHLHINDNDRWEDIHQPVGSASFPWQNYKTFLETFQEEEKPSVLIEVRGYQDLAASVEYMQKEKLYHLQNVQTNDCKINAHPIQKLRDGCFFISQDLRV